MATTGVPAELLPEALANGDVLYEVEYGQIVELEPMGAFETTTASDILGILYPFSKSNNLGRAVSEMLFLLNAGIGLKRRPDVAFVSYKRWKKGKPIPREEAWDVIPELAVEVVSPTNTAGKVLAKIHEYFDAGVSRVWVVYPIQGQVYVYSSPTKVQILTRDNDLDGGEFLPGFKLPLSELFETASDESDE